MIKRPFSTFFIPVLLVGLSGCQPPNEPSPPKITSPRSHTVKKESTIVVPDSVKGKWKAVKITVIDKKVGKETSYSIPIGRKFNIPGSTMSIEVDAFLPAFIMEGSIMTSASNELKNPAAKVRIVESDSGVYNGWLFARYPTTHAFNHPRFGFKLVDAVPATPA